MDFCSCGRRQQTVLNFQIICLVGFRNSVRRGGSAVHESNVGGESSVLRAHRRAYARRPPGEVVEVSHRHPATRGGPRRARQRPQGSQRRTLRGRLWLYAQGGWKFHEFDCEQVIRVNHKEGMQRRSSEWMLPVPALFMRLHRHVIYVFHAASATGTVDMAPGLVPSMVMAMPEVRRRFDWR